MKQIVIENSGIQVSRLAFGTASLHHIFNATDRQRLLHVAADSGITHFDTSPYYGYGLAESDLGKFLRGRRSQFTVATKVGLYPWGLTSNHVASVWARKALGKLASRISAPVVNWDVDRARVSLQGSLKRLNVDYIDFLFLHEPDIALLNADKLLEWIISESTRGTIRAWGVAGTKDRVLPFVQAKHPLASVVQTLDSLDREEANFLAIYGRNFQFTYGYLSSMRARGQRISAEIVIQALHRNQTGAIIVSSCSPLRIAELASVVA